MHWLYRPDLDKFGKHKLHWYVYVVMAILWGAFAFWCGMPWL